MNRTCALAAIVLAGLAARASAGDLATIDRTITKLPVLKSDHPEYCLLVFGADLHKRVWLVHDGDVLYVDRNGNGDLTEPDERIAADPDYDGSKDGVYYFKAGTIVDDKLEHKDLRVGWFRVDHLRDEDQQVKELLDRDPKSRACYVAIDFEMPGQLGLGVGGRVSMTTGNQDSHGWLQFASQPKEAPIIHFGGPWQITFYDKESWQIGRKQEADFAVGAPGIGAGSTAFVEYEGIVPPQSKPKLKVAFPSAIPDQPPIERTYELGKRCCEINLYDHIAVPSEIGTGKARVEVSLPNWPGVTVNSTIHAIDILPAAPKPKVEPVSWRLKSSLPHGKKGEPGDAIVDIQFSPDGSRIIAGGMHDGVVQVWDLASGKRLLTLETGEELHLGDAYFAVSPDWKVIYVPTNRRNSKYERVEKDGKTLNRSSFDDAVRVFDLSSGKLLRSWQHSPPRLITRLTLSPNGIRFATSDQLPGDYENSLPLVTSVWDANTGEHRQLPLGSWAALFSPDSKIIATAIQTPDAVSIEAVKLFDADTLVEKATISMPSGCVDANPELFTDHGMLLAGSVRIYRSRTDLTNFTSAFKFWDAASGKEVASFSAANDEVFFNPKLSPDGHTLASSTFGRDTKAGRVFLLDHSAATPKIVEFGADAGLGEPAFDSTGKWLAVPVNHISIDKLLHEKPSPAEYPQPRIEIVDVATGRIAETLLTPQAYLYTACFSPDGKTLATSGDGEVLLWDFTTPPGEKPK